MVTVGFILVLLIQRVCGWAGLGISSLWFYWLLMFLVLAPVSRDGRSGRPHLPADALPRGRLPRLGLAEGSALRS